TGLPKYQTLKPEYAENVLEFPGIVKLTLPSYEKLILWDFDPEEEGTGDYPPLVEDKGLAKRIVTWLRISLPNPAISQTGNSNNGNGSAGQSVRNAYFGLAMQPQTQTR